MPLLTPLSDDQASPQARQLFATIQSAFGMVPNIFRTMGHAPAVLEHTLGLNQAIQAELDPKLRELAYLTASRINKCGYCEHYHTHLGKKAGLNESQIKEVGIALQSAAYTDLEKLVIRFAEEWTSQGKASAEVVQALRGQLSEAQLVTLAAVVGLANWTNRYNETFGIPLP